MKGRLGDEIDVRPSIEECWNELHIRGALEDDVTLEDFLSVDEDFVSADWQTDADILDSVMSENDPTEEETEEREEEEDTPDLPKKVLEAFQIVRCGIQHVDDVPEDIFSVLNEYEHFFDKFCATNLKQQDIRTYFN